MRSKDEEDPRRTRGVEIAEEGGEVSTRAGVETGCGKAVSGWTNRYMAPVTY